MVSPRGRSPQERAQLRTRGRGGDAADAALADDPDEAFVRIGPRAHPYHGVLESGVTIEDDEPSRSDEPHWTLIGAEMPDVVARAMLGADGDAVPLSAPGADGVASVKRRPSRSRRTPRA